MGLNVFVGFICLLIGLMIGVELQYQVTKQRLIHMERMCQILTNQIDNMRIKQAELYTSYRNLLRRLGDFE